MVGKELRKVGHGSLRETPKRGHKTALTSYNKREDLLHEVASELKNTGYRPSTVVSFSPRVKRLFLYLDETATPFDRVSYREAKGYAAFLADWTTKDGTPLSDRSIAVYLNAATLFYRILEKKGMVLSNPFTELVMRKRSGTRIPHHVPPEAAVGTLLDSLSHFDEQPNFRSRCLAYRAHVVAELLYATGMRIGEAASLKESDLDLDRAVVRIREGKGGRERTAYLNDFAVSVLRHFLELRPLLMTDQYRTRADLLFGVSANALSFAVNKHLSARLAGLTAHGLRHAVGYHLLKSGAPIRSIAAVLGHKQLRSTEVYTKVDADDLVRTLDTYHPRVLPPAA